MKTVVLMSGGLDSTVMIWKLMNEGHQIIPLTFMTYRRNVREIEAVNKIASAAGLGEVKIFDVSFLREIFDFPQHLKERILGQHTNLPNIVIPFRNIIFYGAAAYVACYEEADAVAGGHTREDVEKVPDVGPVFFGELEKLFAVSAPFCPVKILAPLLGVRKPEVLRLGVELGAPLHLTWSCWSVYEKQCGRCPGCEARRAGFAAAGLEDETEYLEK
ncbi:MAG: 7-cyano-7-deazaguanine synthase [Candidatus Caldarchaeum sp.]|nr:7-cyano-7-deazaguanine synthase [Candidatus Caldarchaeum sp.]MDW8436122.1 7-cyano-7-deazaguanine synthase [Candidatus Caldarchaeum sp.]